MITLRNLLIYFCIILTSMFFTFSSCNKDDCTSQSLKTRITSPVNGQEIARGEVVTISTTVDDQTTGAIEVRIFIDEIGKASLTSFPFNYEWNTVEEELGTHTIRASSISNGGELRNDEITVLLTEGGASGYEPVASFSSNVISGSSPLAVDFIDQSTNSPTSWLWYFGDGISSNLQNPSHTYTTEGYFGVTLIVSNTYGTDTLVMPNYINVGSGGGGNGNPCPGVPTVTDSEGNVYNTVQIGNQCWMKENLRIGSTISGADNMTNNGIFERYCYDDIEANCDIYGGLYQWNEMMNYSEQEGAKGICPDGWHIPSDQDWKVLEMSLGMSQAQADAPDWRGDDQGDVIKTTTGWVEGGNGTNTTGFSGLPAGYRGAEALEFGAITEGAYWWTSTQFSDVQTWYRAVGQYTGMINRTYNYKGSGISIRCVKD